MEDTSDINDTNESKRSKDKIEENLISSLLEKKLAQSNQSSNFIY